MPELPEVEVARRNLERWLEGRRVVRAEADATRIFRGSKPEGFKTLRGRLEKAERKGKYLLLTFERGQGLMSHLGMTGKYVRRSGKVLEPYSRARLFLDSGEVIHYRDPRLFGRMEPVPASALWSLPSVAALGIDPWTEKATARVLKERVGSSSQPLKVALMDQGRISGLGNIHAAEALFRARIHPGRKPRSLSDAEWKRLAVAIRKGLEFALRQFDAEEVHYVEEGGAVKNPFHVYGRRDAPCRRCKAPIASFPQGGRTTYYCPGCQPKRVIES